MLLLWLWQEGSGTDSRDSWLEVKASWVQVLPDALRDLGICLSITQGRRWAEGVLLVSRQAIQSEQHVDGFDPALEELTDCDQGGQDD